MCDASRPGDSRRPGRPAASRIQAQDGFTTFELLIVLVILGIVLAGLSQLFTSGTNTELDQNNRVEAQQDARVALDKLRRDFHCASAVTYPAAPTPPTTAITVSLPGYCPSSTSTTLVADTTVPSSGTVAVQLASIGSLNQGATAKNEVIIGSSPPLQCVGTSGNTLTSCTGTAATAGSFVAGTPVGSSITWCSNGAAAPYALKRFVGGWSYVLAASCATAGGSPVLSSLFSNSFMAYYNRAPTFASAVSTTSGGSLDPGTYYYDVTPVMKRSAAPNDFLEGSGTVTTCTITTGPTDTCHITWSAVGFTPPTGFAIQYYNVYGRDNGFSPPRLSPVSGQNAAAESPQGLRLLCSTAAGSSIPCTSGTSYDDNNSRDTANSALARPPLATVSVSLVIDKTPTNRKQRFTLNDNIVSRNSGRY